MYYTISSIGYCFPFDVSRSLMSRHGGQVRGNPDKYGVLAPWIHKKMTESEADDLLCQLIRKHPFMKDAMDLRILVTWHAEDRDLSGIYQLLSFTNPDAGSERKQYVASPIQWRQNCKSPVQETIEMPLGNGVCLVAERNTDPAFPNELFVGLKHGQTWWQDLAVIRAAYQIGDDLSTHWYNDKFEVLVYADKGNEDYTDKFQIDLYREDTLED